MKHINTIINEVLKNFLKENYDVDYDFFERKDELMRAILMNFIFKNNPDFTARVYWRVVPSARLKKIWSDYMTTGVVRDSKGLSMIRELMITNATKLYIMTELSGHLNGGEDPDVIFNENWGEYVDDYISRNIEREFIDPNQTEIPFDNPNEPNKIKDNGKNYKILPLYDNIKNIPFDDYVEENGITNDSLKKAKTDLLKILQNHFYGYYSVDSKGNDILSDYGTEPLIKLTRQLMLEEDESKIVTLIDRMLNVVHQRSDLASLFIEGGSQALSDISGYDVPRDDGWGGYQSKISGKYNMSDYR